MGSGGGRGEGGFLQEMMRAGMEEEFEESSDIPPSIRGQLGSISVEVSGSQDDDLRDVRSEFDRTLGKLIETHDEEFGKSPGSDPLESQ
jgi:hypothetical protein